MDDHISESGLRTLLQAQRMAWARQVPDHMQRMDDLARLRVAFQARFARLAQAMSDDFGQRSRHESQLSDQMTVLHDIDHARRHLKRWMRPHRHWADIAFFPAHIEVHPRPLGVIGVIAPWNYPVSLALMPLVEALAAGNHVMLKPSELTPRTSAALAELIAAVFPPERVTVVQGDAAVGVMFAALPFDHLVFTGSTAVGRKVALAAAANLTPVTLELGGKSPALIAPGYTLALAAARIAQGKLLNAGQTCVATDYVLLPRGRAPDFVQALRAYVQKHYPALRSTPDFSSIVSARHYTRLHALVDDARAQGAEVITLPDTTAHDAARRIFAPTLLLRADASMRVMQEEIFGPILPVLEYDSLEEAIATINSQPRPLALYVFDDDARRAARVIAAIPAGTAGINDTVVQFAQTRLPFGGIGASGMGHLHGHAGFLSFSKQLPVFRQSRWSGLGLLRPPYGKLAERMLRWLAR